MEKVLGYPEHMGPRLRAEVESQLLQDFERYAPQHSDDLAIDWSDSCGEGHATAYLDGWLEKWSSVWVVNAQGKRIAEGWIDFIHGGGDHPLFVFWSSLHLGEKSEDMVRTQGIPQHIWQNLPESSKDLCVKTETVFWKSERRPHVIDWKVKRLIAQMKGVYRWHERMGENGCTISVALSSSKG